MRRALVVAFVAILLAIGLQAGCGPLRTETYDFADFSRVEAGYGFQVEVIQSDSYSISVTASEDVFYNLEVSQEGETLRIHAAQSLTFGYREAVITMPALRAMKLYGSAGGIITGFSSSDDFSLVLLSASSFGGDLTAGDVDFELSGASAIQLEGSADDMVVDASGASQTQLAEFFVRNADVTLSGASTGTVNPSGRLDADLSGGSRLSYTGDPTMGSSSSSGGSTLDRE